MNINNEKYNNLPKEKNHWEKYQLYYLVFGSFFFTTVIILISNHNTSSQIRKIDQKLKGRENKQPNSPNSKEKGEEEDSKFVYPDPNKQNPNWLEQVYQKEVKNDLKNITKYTKNLNRYLTTKATHINQNTIFYGSPGSGKSYYARLMGENESSTYISVKAGTLQRLFVGSGSQKFEAFFEEAKQISKNLPKNAKPVMIIIDEFDSLGGKGKNNEFNAKDDTLINTFLTIMDEIHDKKLNIVVLATTNYLTMIEEAARREGRFNHLIEVKYPKTESEYNELCEHLKKKFELDMKNHTNKEFWASKEENSTIEFSAEFWEVVKKNVWKIVSQEPDFLSVTGFSLLALANSVEMGCLTNKIDDNSRNIIITAEDAEGFANHLKKERDRKLKIIRASKPWRDYSEDK